VLSLANIVRFQGWKQSLQHTYLGFLSLRQNFIVMTLRLPLYDLDLKKVNNGALKMWTAATWE